MTSPDPPPPPSDSEDAAHPQGLGDQEEEELASDPEQGLIYDDGLEDGDSDADEDEE